MLGSSNDFSIFIDWFHYTHKKIFDFYVTILYTHQTVEHWRNPGRIVVEFWVFIDSSHPNIPHTHHDARRSPHDFLFPGFGFVVEFLVFIDSSHPNIPHTHTHTRARARTHTYATMLDAHPMVFCFWVSRGKFFRGPIFWGPFFLGSFFRDSFNRVELLHTNRLIIKIYFE